MHDNTNKEKKTYPQIDDSETGLAALRMGSKKGLADKLEEAIRRFSWLHPDVRPYLDGRHPRDDKTGKPLPTKASKATASTAKAEKTRRKRKAPATKGDHGAKKKRTPSPHASAAALTLTTLALDSTAHKTATGAAKTQSTPPPGRPLTGSE